MGAYNPASYHNGSVWPHDNAIIAAGLLRYGFVLEAQRIATALLEAANYSEGRLLELFCGFSREQLTAPVPQSNGLLTPGLGGDCTDPAGDQPDAVRRACVPRRPVDGSQTPGVLRRPAHHQRTHGGGRITIDITNSVPTVHGLPDGMVFHHGHRPWMTELVEQADRRKSDLQKTRPGGTHEQFRSPTDCLGYVVRAPGGGSKSAFSVTS